MYTDINSKIQENRKFLNLYSERVEKIANNYPFYLIYVSFIGIYLFDFIAKCVEIVNSNSVSQSYSFLITFGLAAFCTIVSLIYFVILFLPRKTAHDFLPKEIYVDYRYEIEEWASKKKGQKLNLDEELEKSYLETLECAVDTNFRLYTRKRSLYFWTIIWALCSLIPYVFAIIIFKTSFEALSTPEQIINIF